jgi:hypothetical protein
MKIITVLTFIVSFLLPPTYVVAGISCDDAKRTLANLQAQENALENDTIKDDKDKNIPLQKLKTERNKTMAELLLLEGVEANIAKFKASLAEIKLDDGPTLADLLSNKEAHELFEVNSETNKTALASSFDNHISAAQNMRATHSLIKDMDPIKFNRFARRAFLDLLELSDYSEYENLSPAAKADKDEQWKKKVTGADLLAKFQEICLSPTSLFATSGGANPCESVNNHLQTNATNQDLIEGYFGLMKYGLMDQTTETKSTDAGSSMDITEAGEFHKSLHGMIKKNIPEKVFENKYVERMNQLKDSIHSISQHKPLLQKMIKAKAMCRLNKTANCNQAAPLEKYGISQAEHDTVAGLEEKYNEIKTYRDEFINTSAVDQQQAFTPEQARKVDADLAKLDNLLGITSQDSAASKLLNADPDEFRTSYDAKIGFQDFFSDDKKNCLDHLTHGFYNGATPDENVIRMLQTLLSKLDGNSCKETVDGLSGKAKFDDSFKENMVGCLMGLQDMVGQGKIDAEKRRLAESIGAQDKKIALIQSSETFKSIQALKAVAIDTVSNPSCSKPEDSQNYGCSVGGTTPVDNNLSYLKVNVGGVLHHIDTSNVQANPTITADNVDNIDNLYEIKNDLCPTEANGQALSDKNALCKYASQQINTINNRREVIRSNGRTGKRYRVHERDHRTGEVISYAKRKSTLEHIGWAGIHGAQIAIPFWAQNMYTDAYNDALIQDTNFRHGYFYNLATMDHYRPGTSGAHTYVVPQHALPSPASSFRNGMQARFMV